MKIFKRFLSFILAGSIMFLAACGGAGNGGDGSGEVGYGESGNGSGGTGGLSVEGRQGRFVEVDISPPVEGKFMSFADSDGTIICFDGDLETRYESTDLGETWVSSPGPFANSENPYFILDMVLLPDGNLLAYDFNEGLLLISPDGNTKPFSVKDIDAATEKGDMVNVSLIQLLGYDKLLLSYSIGGGGMISHVSEREVDGTGATESDGVHEPENGNEDESLQDADESIPEEDFDPQDGDDSHYESNVFTQWDEKTVIIDIETGEVLNDLAIEGAVAAVSDGTFIYVKDRTDSVSVYNLHDGTHSGIPDISFIKDASDSSGDNIKIFGGFGGSELLALGPDGALYGIVDGELLRAETGGVLETVLERSAYTLGTPRNNAQSVFIPDDDTVIVNILSNGQNNILLKYVWDENATLNSDKELTIWSLEENSFVRAAIAQMRKNHPDASIVYEIALDGSGAVSASDAIRNLNTRLLGGDAPDIVIFDGIAYESYTGRGMMLDLSELLDVSDVYENLLDSFKTDGRIFGIPTQMKLPVLMGSTDALNKINNINEFKETVERGNFNPINHNRGRDPFANIDESERSEIYFNDLKELYETLWISAAPGIINNNDLDSGVLRQFLEIVKAISDKLELTVEAFDTEMTSGSIMITDGSSADSLQGSLTQYFMHQTNYAAFSVTGLMILRMTMERNDSDVKVFPGFSPGIWQPSSITGISADSMQPEFAAEFLQTMLSLEVQQFNYATGLPVTREGMDAQTEAVKEMKMMSDDEFTFDINSVIKNLKDISIPDAVLTDTVWESVERFCKNITDIEGAVNEIEQNIRTYLAERS